MLRSKGVSTRQINFLMDGKFDDDSIFDFNEDTEPRQINIFDPYKVHGVKVEKLPQHKESIKAHVTPGYQTVNTALEKKKKNPLLL